MPTVLTLTKLSYWMLRMCISGFLSVYLSHTQNRHYVPAISHRIWKGNQSLCEKCVQINLAGLAIGNGLTAPEEQYKWYPEMVWNNSHGIKVVDEGVYDAMKKAVPACTALIHKCESGDSTIDDFACQAAFVTCNIALTSPYQATG